MNKLIYADEQNEFFKTLIGKTIVEVRGLNLTSDKICFKFNDGTAMRMFHMQDCCECVTIDDICGDETDLVNGKIISIELRTNCRTDPKDEWDESFTWSFYHIKTTKGYVDIKWYGSSNGYYSECVDIEYYTPENDNWEQKFIY